MLILPARHIATSSAQIGRFSITAAVEAALHPTGAAAAITVNRVAVIAKVSDGRFVPAVATMLAFAVATLGITKASEHSTGGTKVVRTLVAFRKQRLALMRRRGRL
jgi:hypothetical protein